MSENRLMNVKVNQHVEVTGKDVRGVVAYVGSTMFASGKWIGVVLDEPRGKNNGSVQGKTYFQCKENHGMFVRQSQLTLLDESGAPIGEISSPLSGASTATTPDEGRPRPRLSSSRLSLVGSRSQGDFPQKDDSAASTPARETSTLQQASEPPSKRASFIEKTHTASSKQASKRPQSLVEANIEEDQQPPLTSVNPSPNLPLLSLAKRAQDKEKLKDYDKTKIQLDQLVEFKTKIMEYQSSLQKDLQRAKQEAKEAIEARNQHAEEMKEFEDTMELLTLDKEMAEEKTEIIQTELVEAREKLEEMTLDLELLKAELSIKEGGGGGGATSYEVKQLEQHNAHLKDTVVRMRDLAAHLKHETQVLQKDLDQKNSEVRELARTKEKLSARIEEMEHQISDLQEQVDACLGAEEMVQNLTDSKLLLEDKLKELEEAVNDLEAIHDMDDILLEGNRELEIELREDVDLANAAARESQREKEAALETLADREQTIAKFRELVQRLQEHNQELQQQLETVSSRPVSALPEMLDFKKMFAETKAHTRAIDLELRRIDVQQSNQHVQYLAAYMPESFMARGGDHDAVLVLLLIPRMLWKVEILLSQVRDKFPEVERIDWAAIIKGHTVEQFTFKSRLSHFIYALQATLHQFLFGLNSCSPEGLLKVGANFPEMAIQEKAVDVFVELLRKDQLDENVPTEALEKCVGYFSYMYPLLLGSETRINQTHLLGDTARALSAACDSIRTDALAVRALIQIGQEGGDMGLLMQHLVTATETIQQQLKVIRRRIPQDRNISQLGFSEELPNILQQCSQHAAKIMKTLQMLTRATIQQVALSGDPDQGVPHDKVKEFAHVASDHVYEQDDRGPVESLKTSVCFILGEVATLTQAVQEAEFDINPNITAEEKSTSPIFLRAQAVKKELEETKNLKRKLEMKESDIKELRVLMKLKQEELSEMTIRKELAEKKFGSVNKDYELGVEKLQRKLDDSQQLLKRKEKEFEETMDHLQADIDSLESERGELKEKLKNYSKKVLIEGLAKTAGLSSGPASFSGMPKLASAVRDSPLLINEIKSLRLALKRLQDEKTQLQAKLMQNQLANLRPLTVPKKIVSVKDATDPKVVDENQDKNRDNLNILSKEASMLLKEIYADLASPKVLDLSNRVLGMTTGLDYTAPANHRLREQTRRLELRKRVEALQSKVLSEVVKRKSGGKVETDFAVFPSPELTKALKESHPIVIGELTIPLLDNTFEGSTPVPLHLNASSLQQLQRALAY
uniref:Dynactin subunit 1 n=1 Tax=Timema monikensis TaxID=170555 RepID=A0A7R9HLD6_9NEOP|nr:unnamed protein product [Timema monikensis]